MPGSAIDLDEGTPLQGFLTCWLSRTQEKMNAQATKMLREVAGPYPTPSRISAMVGGENETDSAPIARTRPFDKGPFSRKLKPPVAGGMTEARIDPDDLRAHLPHLSRKGVPGHDRVLPSWRASTGDRRNEGLHPLAVLHRRRASTGPPGKSGTCGDRNAVSDAGKARDRRRIRCVRSMTSPKRKTACGRNPSCFLACQSARLEHPRAEEIGRPRRAPDNLETVPKGAANGA